MKVFVGFLLFTGLVIVQSSVVSNMMLLQGTADLVMLAMIAWALQERVQTAWLWWVIGGLLASLASGLPFGVLLGAYGVVTGLALILRRRVWKAPILAMLATTFAGTVIVHVFSYLARLVTGANIPPMAAFELITLPSILLNLLLATPAYVLVRDLANWLYPKEIEV